MDALLRRRAMIAAGGGEPPTPPEPPTGVVFYDYLVFDGASYIDLDIIPSSGFSLAVMLGAETAKSEQRVFIATGASSANFGINYNSNTNATNRSINVYYGKSSAVASNRNYAFSNTLYGFFLTPNRYGFNSTSYTISKGSYAPTVGFTLGGNPAHTGSPYTGRMGAFRIFGTDAQNVTTFDGFDTFTPTHTLRPCTFNGQAGMWCVETNTFYGNSSVTGTLSVINNS